MHQGYLQHGDHLWLLFDHLSKYATVTPTQYQNLFSSVILFPAAHDGFGVGQITLCQVCNANNSYDSLKTCKEVTRGMHCEVLYTLTNVSIEH